jgi:DNA-binding CsgD family transcriptional regulator
MTDQSSVFSETTPTQETEEAVLPASEQQQTQEPAPSASSDSMWADQLAVIKNERGEPKYKDLPTALDALRSSQEYIPQLKQDNESLRAELEQLKAQVSQHSNLEETIERLTSQRQQPTQEGNGLTPEQVQEMLEQSLTQRETAQSAKLNAQKVEQAITQKYGDKTRDVVAQRAKELGISPAKLGSLASESPDMVLALFNVKQTSSQGHPSSSSVSIPPINPSKSSEVGRPEKSLLSGAKYSDQRDYMKKVTQSVHDRLGVKS